MTATDRALELIRVAAQAASDKLAENIIAFDVSEQLVITDAFLLASAANDRQVKAIVDEVEDRLREIGAKPVRREGERDGRWVLIDYADIVVHVQHEEERSFYALERLWRDCPVIDAAGERDERPRRGGRRPRRWLTPGDGAGPQARPAPPRSHRVEPDRPGAGPRRRPAGRRRARARRRQRRGCVAALRPAQLWSSDLARAMQTAAYVAEASGLAVQVDPRLREFDVGERQGLTWAESVERFPWIADGVGLGERLAGVPGAESDADVRRRIVPALEEIAASLAPGETAVVVTHGAALKLAVAGLLGWDDAVVRTLGVLDNCHWTTVLVPERRARAAPARLRGGRFRIGPRPLARIPELLRRPCERSVEAAGLWRSW